MQRGCDDRRVDRHHQQRERDDREHQPAVNGPTLRAGTKEPPAVSTSSWISMRRLISGRGRLESCYSCGWDMAEPRPEFAPEYGLVICVNGPLRLEVAALMTGDQYVARPPERSKTAPVLNEQSSEHSQVTRRATSSTVPSRFNGVLASTALMASGENCLMRSVSSTI